MFAMALLVFLFGSPALAAEMAIVQSSAPTTNGGTQDFVASGFGTPLCALFFASGAAANNTVATHGLLNVGVTDFTNSHSIGVATQSGQASSDTGSSGGNSALRTLFDADQSLSGLASASTITNGARLTWTDAPPASYLVNAVLFGGTNVSNCAVGATAGSATLNGTLAITSPGFRPDIVIAIDEGDSTVHARPSIGIAVLDGASIVQRVIGLSDQDAVSPTQTVGSMFDNRIVLSSNGGASSSLELTSFDTNGFTVTTRGAAVAPSIRYLAMKLSGGLRAKLITCPTPTATGVTSCSGSGWTPQGGIVLQTESASLNGYFTADDGEAFGIGAFSLSSSASSAIYTEDNSATSLSESITNSLPVHMRKDSANFIMASFSQFNGNGVEFNYSNVAGTARQLGVLLIEAPGGGGGSSPSFMLRRRQ